MTTIQLKSGYDKRKSAPMLTFRKLIKDEVFALNAYGAQPQLWVVDNCGLARQCRVASKVKTWKTDPNRAEVSLKYGMYESVRWDLDTCLARLLYQID